MARAFFVKCRPQEADIIDLLLRDKRVFVGYPAWRRNGQWDRHDIAKSLLDISVPRWDPGQLDPKRVDRGYSRQVSLNRSFVLEVADGDMVVVPRPAEGICYISRVSGPFELVNDPPWAEGYLDLRRGSGLPCDDERDHIADVVQSWPVEGWIAVPFVLLPRWISYRLLSRNTIGWIEDRPDGRERAADVLEQLHGGTFAPDLGPTTRVEDLEERLLRWISPTALEHLVVDLLQLEHPTQRWWHVGGSGDGGADGLGMDGRGRVVAALTCKWKYDADPVGLGRELFEKMQDVWGEDARVYVAVLYNESDHAERCQGPVTVWHRRKLAELLLKHRSGCATARSLGLS